MSQEDFQPGQIWPGISISAAILGKQWEIESRHQEDTSSLAGAGLMDCGWIDLEWNAREALHLNARWPKAPAFWRHLFLPQEKINTHVLRSLQMLLTAWKQWIQLPQIRATNSLPATTECRLLLNQASGRLEAASAKQDSMLSGRQALQQFSLRQWRLYQQVSAFYEDLQAMATGSAEYGCLQDRESQCNEMAQDITWHTRELHLLVGKPALVPSQMARIKAPRLRINQLMGANCLYHTTLLKTLMMFDQA